MIFDKDDPAPKGSRLETALLRLKRIQRSLFLLLGEEASLLTEIEKAHQDRDSSEFVQVFGRTFRVKEELKELGARWDPRSKTWSVPRSNLDKANQLLANGSSNSSHRHDYHDRPDDEYRDDVDYHQDVYGNGAADGWGTD